jgi:hypothetical protein
MVQAGSQEVYQGASISADFPRLESPTLIKSSGTIDTGGQQTVRQRLATLLKRAPHAFRRS